VLYVFAYKMKVDADATNSPVTLTLGTPAPHVNLYADAAVAKVSYRLDG
jgi:hypothetical protein